MISLAGCCCVACLPLAAALFALDRRARRRECRMMEGLRREALYARLHGEISRLNTHCFDQVRIEPSCVTVTSVMPAHILLYLECKQNGNEKRNGCFTRLTAQLLAEDFPFLGEEERYRLSRYRIYRVNGRREYGYLYTLRRRHKAELLRAHSALRLRVY